MWPSLPLCSLSLLLTDQFWSTVHEFLRPGLFLSSWNLSQSSFLSSWPLSAQRVAFQDGIEKLWKFIKGFFSSNSVRFAKHLFAKVLCPSQKRTSPSPCVSEHPLMWFLQIFGCTDMSNQRVELGISSLCSVSHSEHKSSWAAHMMCPPRQWKPFFLLLGLESLNLNCVLESPKRHLLFCFFSFITETRHCPQVSLAAYKMETFQMIELNWLILNVTPLVKNVQVSL